MTCAGRLTGGGRRHERLHFGFEGTDVIAQLAQAIAQATQSLGGRQLPIFDRVALIHYRATVNAPPVRGMLGVHEHSVSTRKACSTTTPT
jgi:hypothetical protein